jgi:hypothetical protein
MNRVGSRQGMQRGNKLFRLAASVFTVNKPRRLAASDDDLLRVENSFSNCTPHRWMIKLYSALSTLLPSALGKICGAPSISCHSKQELCSAVLFCKGLKVHGSTHSSLFVTHISQFYISNQHNKHSKLMWDEMWHLSSIIEGGEISCDKVKARSLIPQRDK